MNHLLPGVLNEVRGCQVCSEALPLGARPLLSAHGEARVLLIGQAPGKAAHEAGIPWLDRSGDRLRDWMGVSREEFYDEKRIAIVPTGFCYPGTGKSGDLPPRPECAPLWHHRILPLLTNVEITIYLGSYATALYLGSRYGGVTEAALDFRNLLPGRMAVPHPSPRNAMWAKRNPWFAAEALPALRQRVREALNA